jgi:hypothetical protein
MYLLLVPINSPVASRCAYLWRTETHHVRYLSLCIKIIIYYIKKHVRWVPCHHGMSRPQVADGGDDFQIWRVAANILNKQSWTANRGQPTIGGPQAWGWA